MPSKGTSVRARPRRPWPPREDGHRRHVREDRGARQPPHEVRMCRRCTSDTSTASPSPSGQSLPAGKPGPFSLRLSEDWTWGAGRQRPLVGRGARTNRTGLVAWIPGFTGLLSEPVPALPSFVDNSISIAAPKEKAQTACSADGGRLNGNHAGAG